MGKNLVAWALLGLVVPGTALAEEPALTVALDWNDWDARCVGARALSADVEGRVGRPVFVPRDDAELVIRGAVHESDGRFRVELALETGDGADLGTRELASDPGADCRALDEQLSLVVALVVESPSTRRAVREATPPWRAELAVAGRAMLGLVPDVGLGLGLDVVVIPPHFIPLLVELTGFFPTEAASIARPSAGVRVHALEAALFGCPRPLEGEFGHLDLCVGARGGLLHASGYGLDQNEAAVRPTFAPMLEVRAGVRPGPALVGVAIGGGVEVIRDELRIDLPDGSTELLHQAPLFFGRVGVFVGLRL